VTAARPAIPFRIRRAAPNDAAAVAGVGARLFAQTFAADNTPENLRSYLARAFSEAAQRAELEDPVGRIWLAETDGHEPVGYSHLRLATAPTSGVALSVTRPAELARLYADRSLHGAGLGAALLETCAAAAAANGADCLWLGVWQQNTRAIAFYEKHGFVRVGEQEFLLGADRQRDWLMLRRL
jgi:ribosomal protein S18 acetylase RimI-like enzyme